MARTKGSGTPHKRNGIWVQWLSFTASSGEVIRKKVEGQTKQQVIERVAKLRALHKDGVDLSRKPPKIRDYLPEWISTTYAHSGVKPRSIATYRQVARDYLIPRLGEQRIDVQGSVIRTAMQSLSKDGFSAQTVGLCITVLRGMFDFAIIDELIARSPMAAVKAPRATPSPAKSLTPDEAQRFREAARSHRLGLGLQLGLILGLRRGEVSGIKWEDVDLDTGILRIHRNIQYIPPHEDTPGQLLEGTTKGGGQRLLKLSPSLIAGFRDHEQRQQIERAAMAGRWRADEGYVFVAVTHGGRMNSNSLYTAFRDVCADANITGYRLHDLRHSTASLLFASGTPDKLVSSALGHSNTTITKNLYTHLFPGALDAIAESVERMLGDDAQAERHAP